MNNINVTKKTHSRDLCEKHNLTGNQEQILNRLLSIIRCTRLIFFFSPVNFFQNDFQPGPLLLIASQLK